MIDYILGFADEATAQIDPVVGAFYTPASSEGIGQWRGDNCISAVVVTVLGTGSILMDPITGQPYTGPNQVFDSLWRIIISQKARLPALDAHPATQLVADRDAASSGAPLAQFILQNILPLTVLATLEISPTPLGARYPFG